MQCCPFSSTWILPLKNQSRYEYFSLKYRYIYILAESVMCVAYTSGVLELLLRLPQQDALLLNENSAGNVDGDKIKYVICSVLFIATVYVESYLLFVQFIRSMKDVHMGLG